MTPIAIAAAAAAGGQVLNTIRSTVNYINKLEGNTSLTDITQVSRVEPITVVSQDCLNLEYLPDVMNSLQSIFTAYYLQALAITTNISNVKVGKILGKLNPNTQSKTNTKLWGFESYKDEPTYTNASFGTPWLYVEENYKYKLPVLSSSLSLEDEKGVRRGPADGYEVKDLKQLTPITDVTNLSVGKLINITITENGQSVVVPISVRLMVTSVPEKSLVSMLTMQNRDTTFKERFHAYRAGKIGFIKDLILCQDLIDESKKSMMKDKDGVISEIFQRSNNSKLTTLFGGDLNLASASNLYVISEATQSTIEQKLSSKLSNFQTREKLFKSGYMMILVVVDRTWEMVTFYHRGLATGTTIGVKSLKASNKGTGPDIGDILKAYMIGNSPKL